MSGQGVAQPCAGWFGKIPALGDFITRGLPASFVTSWDAWLSGELAQARQVLGEGWDEAYAGAPTLCFSLTPGALEQAAWHGILAPSFDRVGRQFPLTLALSGPPELAAGFGRRGWAQLCALGRQARESESSAEELDEALGHFIGQHFHSPAPQDREPWRVGSALATLPEGLSLWWSQPALEGREAVPILFYGLPRGEWFRELLSFP
jgi:type VI secretion system ImpM family protein